MYLFFFVIFIKISYADPLTALVDLNLSQREHLKKNHPIVKADVGSMDSQTQKLALYVSSLHPKKCRKALRKLSLYEDYSQFIDFFTSSKYNSTTTQLDLELESVFFSAPLRLSFKIARITKPGRYNFIFDKGFLKGLKGLIRISKYKKRCFIELKADWMGPKTPFPDLLFETFTSTLSKIGIKKLIRISSL